MGTSVITIPKIGGAYQVAIGTTSNYLNETQQLACVENLQAIETIEETRTIEVLASKGELSDEDCSLVLSLQKDFEISAARMTVDEARLVHQYASSATEEVKKDKVEKIGDALSKVLHGKNTRRDYERYGNRGELLQRLIQKGLDYEDGKYDFTRTFDHSIYPLDESLTKEEWDVYLYALTDEELLEGDYISEDDFYVHGPYTARDIRDIAKFTRETWSKVTDTRNIPRLEALLDQTIVPTDFGLDGDLNRHFIATHVLPSRRPDVYQMILILSSFGQHVNDTLFIKGLEIPIEIESLVGSLKKSLGWCSYYATMICDIRQKRIKEVYKVARPYTTPYYKELIEQIDQWTPRKRDMVNRDFGPFLVKLDGHIFEAQEAFDSIMMHLKKTKGATSKVSGFLAVN